MSTCVAGWRRHNSRVALGRRTRSGIVVRRGRTRRVVLGGRRSSRIVSRSGCSVDVLGRCVRRDRAVSSGCRQSARLGRRGLALRRGVGARRICTGRCGAISVRSSLGPVRFRGGVGRDCIVVATGLFL